MAYASPVENILSKSARTFHEGILESVISNMYAIDGCFVIFLLTADEAIA
jgi:hypothetical protein